MSQGLQIWDAGGALVMDTTTRVATLVGRVATGTSNGSVSNAALAKGVPIYFTVLDQSAQTNPYWQYYPSFFISGTTLSWSFSDKYPQYRASLIVTYGYF